MPNTFKVTPKERKDFATKTIQGKGTSRRVVPCFSIYVTLALCDLCTGT